MSGSRYFWISLALCFIIAAVVSETVIAVHADHDCRGEGCPVCLLMQRAENFSRNSGYAAIHSVFSAAGLLLAAVVLNFAVFRPVPLSSVRLKVKMNT
jgi:hypothetical protein